MSNVSRTTLASLALTLTPALLGGCGAPAAPGAGETTGAQSEALTNYCPATPNAITAGAHGPFAVDATNAYFYDAPPAGPVGVASCALAGCAAPTMLVAGTYPGRIVTDATNVYWSNEGTGTYAGDILACAKTGCGGIPTVLASGQGNPIDVAVDASNVYWTTYDATLGSLELRACAVGGCNGKPRTITGYYPRMTSLVSDGSRVYFMSDSQILACPTTGCINQSPTVIASGQSPSGRLVLAGGTLYWGNYYSTGAGAVMACATSGCGSSPTLLASTSVAVQDLGVNATGVTWVTNPSGGEVISLCAAGGCGQSPKTLYSTSPALAISVAVDASNVYWVDADQQTLFQLPDTPCTPPPKCLTPAQCCAQAGGTWDGKFCE